MAAKRVRVKDPISGAQYDVPVSRLAVCPGLIVLDKPTGQRPKPRLPLGKPLPGSKADIAAKRAATRKDPAPETPDADENDGQPVDTEKETD